MGRHLALLRGGRVCAFVVVLAACSSPRTEPPRPIRIATGSPSGVYYPLGRTLADAFNQAVPGVQAVAEPSGATLFNIEALEERKAELGLALADVAYSAYARGTFEHGETHRMLRGIAVLYVNVLQIITRADGPVLTMADLRRGRIGYGMAVVPEGAPERSATIDLIAGAYNLEPKDFRVERMPFSEMIEGLRTGSLQAGIVLAGHPFPAITALAQQTPIRLVGLDRGATDRIRGGHPFYKPAVIPAGTYPGQDRDVTSVGVDNLLLCREDLDESLVYNLTRALFEALPRAVDAGGYLDPDLAAASPIPLHPGAARYYRARELLY